MILVCGATGLLGGAVVDELLARGARVRALVRPSADAGPLAARGVEIARGDLRTAESLPDAVADADTVVTTVTAMSRLLQGGERTTIAATDGRGTINLIEATERAGVERFGYVSYAGLDASHRFPLARAKLAAEARLRASELRPIVFRPDLFQEVWLGAGAGFDWAERRATIYGRGDNPLRYLAVGDAAAAIARSVLDPDPPPLLEFGGPEALAPNEVVGRARERLGELRVRRVPRVALAAGRTLLTPFKQELASVLGLALFADTVTPTWSDAPLRALGLDPRPASAYLDLTLGAHD